MASLGRLWVGTDAGIILAYPLPRLRDGIPRIQERPQVALHGHSGPVRYLIPVQYGPLTGSPIRRRPESVLKKYKVEESVIQHLPKVSKAGAVPVMNKQYSTSPERDSVNTDNIYEEISIRSSAGSEQGLTFTQEGVYEPVREVTPSMVNDNTYEPIEAGNGAKASEPEIKDTEVSGEHTYFVLEPQANGQDRTQDTNSSVQNGQPLQADTEGGAQSQDAPRTQKEAQHKTPEAQERNEIVNPNKACVTENEVKKTVSDRLSNSEVFQRGVIEELQEKVKKRRSLDDLTDLDANPDNVGLLYPTLARPKTLARDLCRDSLSGKSALDEEILYMRTGMSNPILTRRPDYSSMRNLNRRSVSDITKKSKKEEDSGKKKKVSVSFREKSKEEPVRKMSMGTSFAAGSGVDTLRKQDSNTILVLSGGDGYKDWKKRQSLPNYRPEEPCLVFWMYKF